MSISESEIVETNWDAIVIGSGVGGATTANQLIKYNKKVLILEKGPSVPEQDRLPLWRDSVFDLTSKNLFHPFLGEGVGGSSRLFGMVMERLEQTDFQNLGGRWPFTVKEWEPYFLEAESLFGVKPSLVSEHFDPLLKHLSAQQLNPRALSLAYTGNPSCNFCQSRICQNSCKIDAWTGPLNQVAKNSNLALVSNAEVLKVLCNSDQAIGVEAIINQRLLTIKADKFYLGLGALRTPYLLKNSQSATHKSGLGNSREMLGKNLMRHFIDLYFLNWPGSLAINEHKSIGINDFYVDSISKSKLGVFQSFGALPPIEYVLSEIFESSPWVRHVPGSSLVIEKVVKKLFSSHVMASIIEDSPIATNRLIFKDDKQVRIEYKISNNDKKKIERSREIGRKMFSPMLKKIQYQAENNKRLAHVCGTCVMGESIEDSVVNWNGRLHELENLFIVDSSVFPSSTGKNPSLTIAANAIRITHNSIGNN